MASIVYLDVEDEITTAAARIRAADAPRVGMVIPFGSRVATSRINFRLLAREAQAAGRRLDVIAPDASARALAASAGLPVFAAVGEYEAALASGEVAAAEAVPAPTAEPGPGATGRGAVAAGAAVVGAAAAGAGPDAPSTAAGGEVGDEGRAPAVEAADRLIGAPGRSTAAGAPIARDVPVASSSRRRGSRAGLVVLFLAIALVVAFGITAAVMLLPSAAITVTPELTPVAPVSLTVRADPSATAVDPSGPTIPATTVSVPVTASGDFPATGTTVQQTPATGQVTFSSINTVNAMPIPRGTRVSTSDGIVFTTTAAVSVPRATVSGTTITRGRASVGVVAASPGPNGNVAAGAIDQVPSSLAALQVSVSNGAPTTGGTRTELPKITTADVAGAKDQLGKQLEAQVATAVADPSLAPPGTTLFPETAKVGAPTYTPDTATLEGKTLKAGQTTFPLQADATATVLAVDASPLKALGEAAIRANVTPGSQLVPGSVQVSVGQGTVGEDGTVSYTVTVTALEQEPISAAALEAQVLGMPEAEAQAALSKYGAVDISLWPFWVTSVPTNADRVSVTIAAPSSPSPSAAPAPTPSPSPTRSPASHKPPSPSPVEPSGSPSPVPSA